MSARRPTIAELQVLGQRANFHPDQLAALWPISKRQMERVFQCTFHKTPRTWLRELQCRLALNLVSQRFSNKAITFQLGFANETHFCRAFRKAFGATPRAIARAFVEEKIEETKMSRLYYSLGLLPEFPRLKSIQE